jgi:hypothetical protein
MLFSKIQDRECPDLLARLGLGRLGCARDNQPYVVPIYFAYEPDHLYAFATFGLGSPIAIKAMAAKLARLVYRILRYGMKYADQGAKFYEAQHRNPQIKQLKWKATRLGFQVVEAPGA